METSEQETEPVRRGRTVGDRTAIGLAFGSSAAVLVLELVSLRLVAPYLGLTLETNTTVIGVALAAIATGAALGGRFADQVPPTRSLGPLLIIAGGFVMLVLPVARWTGSQVRAGGDGMVFLAVGAAMFVPAAMLAAVTPMVTKLRLASLSETGTVVGRLSAWATAGAIAGTVLTGFVFIANLPTSWIVLALGMLLAAAGVVLTLVLRGMRDAAGPLVFALIGAGATLASPRYCEVETAYHCARVVADPGRPSGRTLYLDVHRHSYVDLDDPAHLEFEYARAMVGVIEAARPGTGPLRALHIGGGGLTIPRYLLHTRPGSSNQVYEIDQGVVDIDVERLGARLGEDLRVTVEDGRTGVRSEPSGGYDVVVGDAFGGSAVPWHLTTRELVTDVRRVLRPGGIYALNMIDFHGLSFARAETRTLRAVLPHVVVLAKPRVLGRTGDGGNIVAVGSDQPLPVEAIRAELARRETGWDVLGTPEEVDRFVGDAPLLTDDFAPVDQLLTPYP